MIFVTVGTQLPFPRLLAMMEEVASRRPVEILAQTGDPAYRGPLPSVAAMDRAAFEDACARASLIVGHAGTGTILAARRHGKSLIVVPRRLELGEHRNDHQSGTAEQLRRIGEAAVCETVEEIVTAIDTPPPPSHQRAGPERQKLIDALAGMIGEAVRH